jgi:hypothetical protein
MLKNWIDRKNSERSLTMEEIKTLSYGANATKFEAEIYDGNIMIIMGPTKGTLMKFKVSDIDRIIDHFKDRDWFRFDGSMEKTTPGGLRHFFEAELKRPPKLASHVAAWMVHKRLLEHRYTGNRNVVEMKIKNNDILIDK